MVVNSIDFVLDLPVAINFTGENSSRSKPLLAIFRLCARKMIYASRIGFIAQRSQAFPQGLVGNGSAFDKVRGPVRNAIYEYSLGKP